MVQDFSALVYQVREMKTIPLTRGQVAMVDDTDYKKLSAFRWFAVPKRHGFYAARQERVRPGKQRTIYMHKEILGIGPGVEGHHKNGNKLDNQRRNLKRADRFVQMRGFLSKRRGASSQYRGVSWCNTELKWLAQVRADRKTKFLGYFHDERAAAAAYNGGAVKYFGGMATQNKIA